MYANTGEFLPSLVHPTSLGIATCCHFASTPQLNNAATHFPPSFFAQLLRSPQNPNVKGGERREPPPPLLPHVASLSYLYYLSPASSFPRSVCVCSMKMMRICYPFRLFFFFLLLLRKTAILGLPRASSAGLNKAASWAKGRGPTGWFFHTYTKRSTKRVHVICIRHTLCHTIPPSRLLWFLERYDD